MIHIPVLRWGEPYKSLEIDKVVHFATGSPVAEVSQANGGLVSRDMRLAGRARDALREVPIHDLLEKIKKAADGSAPSLALTQNPDILRELSTDRAHPGPVIVGFAAETGDDTGSVLDLARAKLARKGCDLLVVNDVSGGAVFGSPDNEAVILAADGAAVDVPHGSKSALAHVIWDEVASRLQD